MQGVTIVSERIKFHNLVIIMIKIGSLKSTGSAKRSFKIKGISLSDTAVRNKRCSMFDHHLQ